MSNLIAELSLRTTWRTTCCTWWAPDVLHVICTRFCPDHILSVRVGDSSRRSEEIVNTFEFRFQCCCWCRYYYYYYIISKGQLNDEIALPNLHAAMLRRSRSHLLSHAVMSYMYVTRDRFANANFTCRHTETDDADRTCHRSPAIYWHQVSQSWHWPNNVTWT